MSVYAKDYGYFFNSSNQDRTYNAESFEEWLKPFFLSGVFNGDLQVSAQETPDMTVSIAPGHANLDGKPAAWTDTNTLQLSAASGIYDRIDTIVLRRDNTARAISIEVVTGTASSNPQPTAPTRDSDVFELVVAQIRVGVGATSVTNANITDTRMDADLCGWVAATVDQIDFAQITQQFVGWEDEMQAYFTTWFESIRDQLDEDAAGHLQNEIDEMKAKSVTTVNGAKPLNGGAAFVSHVRMADDLSGDDYLLTDEPFIMQKTPVNADVPARLHVIRGNRVHVPNTGRGTIYPVAISDITRFCSTGRNLLDPIRMRAVLPNYRHYSTYQYIIVGAYTSLAFYNTDGEYVSEITPYNDKFDVPADGMVKVTGGNQSTTAIFMCDWGGPYEWEAYDSGEISLNLMMAFPYGLCYAGGIYDEINFDQQRAIRRIQRTAYTDERLSEIKATGRAYEYDDNYIYYELESPAFSTINVDPNFVSRAYGVNGMNFRDAKNVAPSYVITYGTSPRKKLDAASDNLAVIVSGDTASVNVSTGDYVLVVGSTIANVDDGLYIANSGVTAGTPFVSSNLTATSKGGLNALKGDLQDDILPEAYKIVSYSGNLNSLAYGAVYSASSSANNPTAHNYFVIAYTFSTSTAFQIAIRGAGSTAWFRTKTSGTWNAWKQFTLS